MAIIRTISLPEDLNKTLEELKLSPSKLLQVKIEEMRQEQNLERPSFKMLQASKDRILRNLQNAIEFITLKGLFDEFNKKYNENEEQ